MLVYSYTSRYIIWLAYLSSFSFHPLARPRVGLVALAPALALALIHTHIMVVGLEFTSVSQLSWEFKTFFSSSSLAYLVGKAHR